MRERRENLRGSRWKGGRKSWGAAMWQLVSEEKIPLLDSDWVMN